MERMACHLKRLSLLLLACAACPGQTPPPVTVPDGIALEANIAYDRFPDTRLDVLYPKAPSTEKRPGVIMFHGGGWIRSTKETMMQSFCLPYLERGFVVANVEYRVAGAAPAPAAVNDALHAAKWFFDRAAKYHVDPARIAVTGASAGGHLALMVGMTPASAGLGPAIPIAAIVNGYGVTDVADLLDGPHRQSFAVEWLPEQPGRSDLARRLSPLTYVRKGLPPTLTVQGENDRTVPYEQGARLTAALKQAGVDAEMMTVPGAGHGFSKEQWPAVHARIFDFLAQRGILAAAQAAAPAAAQNATRAAAGNAGDETAIKDVVARYVDARDRKDAKATEALFTADADQLVSSGEWRKGRDAVVRGTMASSESSGGKRTITVRSRPLRHTGRRAGRRRLRNRRPGRRPAEAHVEHLPDDPHARWLAHRRHPQHAARPAGAAEVSGVNWNIRLATPADTPALTGLIDASVRGLQAEDYTPAQFEGALREV